jgi:Matrixin
MLASARLLCAIGVACVSSLWQASIAHAYCRETVEAESSGPCIEEPGVPLLHWKRGCMTYAINDRVPERLELMTEAEIRRALAASFEAWREVDCGARGEPFSVQQAEELTPTFDSEFVKDAPNEAVITARTRREWSELEHDSNALAITLLWHDVRTGEILDVDMELNTGAGRFADCAKRSCGTDVMDLQNTITHEAGHLLGLGHSSQPDCGDCTMLADAPDGELAKRSLEQDDLDGYCSLELPRFECEDGSCVCPAPAVFPSSRTVTSCACSSLGARPSAPVGWLYALATLAAWLGARTMRRARRDR